MGQYLAGDIDAKYINEKFLVNYSLKAGSTYYGGPLHGTSLKCVREIRQLLRVNKKVASREES
jgi:hypothetical protein